MGKPESQLLSIGLTIVVSGVGLLVVHFVARCLNRVLKGTEAIQPEQRQQFVTLVQILRWVAGVLIVVAAILTVMSSFVDIAPLLAGAGVAGLAISLGAQTLIKDLLAGLTILLENQYAVGDVIRVGGVSGAVERLTLRATHVRDADGCLHIVPNGEVRVVSNMTKEWSRALVDVGVAYEADLDHALGVLEEIAGAFAEEPAFRAQLLEKPQVIGPLSLGDWAVTLRVMVKTRPGKHWAAARELRKRILVAFERESIVMPYPRQEVLVRRPDDGF